MPRRDGNTFYSPRLVALVTRTERVNVLGHEYRSASVMRVRVLGWVDRRLSLVEQGRSPSRNALVATGSCVRARFGRSLSDVGVTGGAVRCFT